MEASFLLSLVRIHDNRTFCPLLVACLYINFNSPYSVNEYKEKRGEVGMCYGGYGYGGGYSGGGISSFALIVVLFILLVIVGASFYN